MLEPRQRDIDRYRKSFMALYKQEGANIVAFINSVAEAMAYQRAVNRSWHETTLWLLKGERMNHVKEGE